jgi:hypothetical protein
MSVTDIGRIPVASGIGRARFAYLAAIADQLRQSRRPG